MIVIREDIYIYIAASPADAFAERNLCDVALLPAMGGSRLLLLLLLFTPLY